MKLDVILGITSSVGLFHAVFLAGYLLVSKKGHRLSNILLAALLLAFGVRIFKSTFFAVTGFTPEALPVIGLLGMSLNGPLLLIYISVLKGDSIHSFKNYIHALWPLFVLSNMILVSDAYLRVSYMIIIVAQFGFIGWGYYAARSWKDANQKAWLYALTTTFLAIEVVYLAQWTQLDLLDYVIATLVSSICLLVLTYMAVLKYDLFKKVHHYRLAKVDVQNTAVLTQLRRIIIDEEGFRNSELSLKTLSDTLSVSTSKVSMLVQTEFNKTLPELLSNLRLQYVTEQLQRLENMDKVEALAYDAGFQSPSTFYAQFRKTFKMTPSQYRERVRVGSAA